MSSIMGRCQVVCLRPCRGFCAPAAEKVSPGCVTAGVKCQPLRLRRRLGRQCRSGRPQTAPANDPAVSGANTGVTSVQPPQHQCPPPWWFHRCDVGRPCRWSHDFHPMHHGASQAPPPECLDATQATAAVPTPCFPVRCRYRQRAMLSAAEEVEGDAAAPPVAPPETGGGN